MINMTEKSAGSATAKAVKTESRSQKARKESKPLKRHFKYIVPQYRLILVKEPGIKPTHISDPISFHHREDIETTKQLIEAGKIMGVPVVDHCIVSSESMNSLRETEPQLWFD